MEQIEYLAGIVQDKEDKIQELLERISYLEKVVSEYRSDSTNLPF